MNCDPEPLTPSSLTLGVTPAVGFDAALRRPPQRSAPGAAPDNDGLAHLIYWLVDALHPKLVVGFGDSDRVALNAARQAAATSGLDTRFVAVDACGHGITAADQSGAGVHGASHAGDARPDNLDTPILEFQDGSIDLLLVSDHSAEDPLCGDGLPWRVKLSDRAVALRIGATGRPTDATQPVFRFNDPAAVLVGLGSQQTPALRAFFEATQSPSNAQAIQSLFEHLSRSARHDVVVERLPHLASEMIRTLEGCAREFRSIRSSLDRASVTRTTSSPSGDNRNEPTNVMSDADRDATRSSVAVQGSKNADALEQAIRERDAASAAKRDLESRLTERHAEIAKLVDMVASLQDRLATAPSATGGSAPSPPPPPKPSPSLADAYRRVRRWLGALAGRHRKGPSRADIRACRESGLFDEAWYLSRYPDVKTSGAQPIEHFLVFGWVERRDPGPGFNTSEYLRLNPDVAASNVNPLLHFIRHGAREGRNLPTGYRLPGTRHGH